MSALLELESGRSYLGAIDKPFYVTRSMLLDRAAAEGFADVRLWDADDAHYNLLARGRYVREERAIELPNEVKWAFAVDESNPSALPAGAPEPERRVNRPVAQAMLVTATGAALWGIWRKVKRWL